MGTLARCVTRPQAPIFRPPYIAWLQTRKALVQPLSVFAARRQSFDVIVRKLALDADALVLIFGALPLEESGWDMGATTINRAGTSADKWPIWRVSRG